MRDFNRESFPFLYLSLKELSKISLITDGFLETSVGQKGSKLEESTRIIMRAFTLCINDREPLSKSRKWGTLKLFNLLFKLYQKLSTLNLARNLIRAIDTSKDLPAIVHHSSTKNHFPKNDVIAYLYHRGYFHFWNESSQEAMSAALECFQQAFDMCPDVKTIKNIVMSESSRLQMKRTERKHLSEHLLKISDRNKERILKYLIPLMILSGKLPKNSLFDSIINPVEHELQQDSDVSLGKPNQIYFIYKDLVQSIKTGNLALFDYNVMSQGSSILISEATFLLVEKCRLLVLRSLVKRVYLVQGRNTRLSLESINCAIHFCYKYLAQSSSEQPEYNCIYDLSKSELSETECLVCILISRNLVKGYISHEHCTVVLSQKDAFPKISSALNSINIL